MLNIRKLSTELYKKEDEIKSFFKASEETLKNYQRILRQIREKPYEMLLYIVEKDHSCEVVPSAEYKIANDLVIEFKKDWNNLEQAFKWAVEILQERVTFGVDGSQDYFIKEFNFPIGMVQVGWFINAHKPEAEFEKDAEPFLISPQEIIENQSEEISAENYIAQRRFQIEVEKTKEFLRNQKGWKQRGEKVPVAFFDGAFLISLARRKIQESLLRSVIELIKLSEEAQVPVVGYIDRSYSYDLSSFFKLFGMTNEFPIDNATLIEELSLLKSFGDRTIFFNSRRKDLKTYFQDSPIGFVYLRTSNAFLPSRLDIPAWILEENLLDEVLDVVLAECVVGEGYPYPLSIADQMAVITNEDKNSFLELISGFSSEKMMKLMFSRKFLSKRMFRRINFKFFGGSDIF